jgi:alanine racemase
LIIGEKMIFHRIYAKIDIGAIAHNINLIKSKIGKARLMFVIKADAYGHGAPTLAREFEEMTDYFAVAEMREALELRGADVKKPILILGYTPPAMYEEALENDITLTVFSADGMRALSDTARTYGKNARVHLAVDTGMGRIGWQVSEKGADEAALVASMPHIEAEGIFSHFSCADTDKTDFTQMQMAEFERFIAMLSRRGVDIPIKHISNSAGILTFGGGYDMARAGIVIYGLYPSEKMKREHTADFALRPAMELLTYVSHVKELEAGSPVSYGASYITSAKTRVATIPVGYADGYPRALSDGGDVLILGKRCPIIGKICMDQMMVDVTELPFVRVGDKVTLVGADGDEYISADEAAEKAGSFSYEFICGISRRVPRVYVGKSDICK